MLTAEILRSVAPRARPDYIQAMLNGKEIFDKYGINTPMRMTHFLAQVSHETGGLTIVRENMNYTAKRIREVWPSRPEAAKFAGNPQGLANCVYNGRMGNRKGSDDGWHFRGGGLLQTTGRDNYERLEKATGIPFASKPETIETASASLVAACWEISKFHAYCDRGEKGLRAVSNGINRGNPASSQLPIGWADRQLCFQKALNGLAVCVMPSPDDDILEVGDHGADVTALQQRLNELGYLVGKVDGVFGSRVRGGVLAFQAENGLKTDGKVGPMTLEALGKTAKPFPIGERATETKADLLAAGSTTIKATSLLKTAATVGGTLGTGVAAADTTGALTGMSSLVGDLKEYQGIAGEIAGIAQWAFSHWYFLIPLVAYLIYRYADQIEIRRVLEHNLGINLSK